MSANLNEEKLYCEFCGEEIDTNKEHFEDWLGSIFCDRAHFYRSREYRDPKVFLIQKDIDRHAPRISNK